MKKSFLILPFLFTFSLLTGCNLTLAQDVTPPPGYTPEATIPPAATAAVYPLLPPDPVQGQLVYENECASCHGVSGMGDGSQSGNLAEAPTVLKNDGTAFTTSLVKWYETITNHATSNTMPAFSSVVSDRTRWDISAYLYMMNTPNEDLNLGKEVYTASCLACHGEKGKGDGPNARDLSIQPPDFTFERLLAPRSDHDLFDIVTNGSSGVMPAYSDLLSTEERKAVVAYVRSLSFKSVETSVSEPSLTEPVITELPQPVVTSAPATDNPASASNHVAVFGKIINDSGKSLPAGMKVTLKIFDNMQASGSLETEVAADGSYRFDAIEMNGDRIVIATVEYDGQMFNSDPSRLPTTNPEENSAPTGEVKLDIHVSETTTDTSSVSVDRMHIFFDFSREGVVQVVELLLVSNSNNVTIVPASEDVGVLSFEVPDNATNLQFQDSVIGERYLATAKGFMDTAPVPPGEDSLQVLFAYDLPYDNRATINVPIPYDTNAVIVMAPVEGVKFSSDGLVDGGIRTTEQSTFRVYNGANMKAGSTLSFTLTGQPKNQTSTIGPVKFNTGLVGGGVLVLVLLISGVYVFRRRRINTNPTHGILPGQAMDQTAVMDAIISLDEQFKNGKISETAYQLRRAELKKQLEKLL